jgi:hypothetical protein
LITTVHDVAKFDIGLKSGIVMQKETLAAAWKPSGGPHRIGWFVQSYNGENVVWQFGSGENGSSSMIIMLPARSVTLVLTANSNGLVKGFGLSRRHSGVAVQRGRSSDSTRPDDAACF